MKKEYDFSKGARGRFFRPKVQLNLPVYLDADVAAWVKKFAKRNKLDAQSAVNNLLRNSKGMAQPD